MKPRCSNHRNHALTLMDVVIILCIICVLAMMLMPRLSIEGKGAKKISCTSNLKQVSLAMKIWEGDNNDKLPMEASVTNGGTMELMNSSEAWRAFQVVSNELSTPYPLFCPADKTRTRTTLFDDSLRQHISYFVSLDATEYVPQSILFGDSSFEFHNTDVPAGLFDLTSNSPPQWSSARHPNSGNFAFADGSVQGIYNTNLIEALTTSSLATNRIFIP